MTQRGKMRWQSIAGTARPRHMNQSKIRKILGQQILR
jgi:hypothetical protein